MAFSAKQKAFSAEYLIDLNATQAAIRAGYSKKTAGSAGQRLLQNVEMQAAIAKGQADRAVRTEITQDRVFAELAKIGFSDIRKVLTADGNLTDPKDWDDDTAGAIASLEVVTVRGQGDDERSFDHIHKIKVWDKLAALDKIGKHLGMFVDRVEHSGPNGGAIKSEETGSMKMALFLESIAKRR